MKSYHLHKDRNGGVAWLRHDDGGNDSTTRPPAGEESAEP